MSTDELYQVVSQWYSAGLLLDSDKPALKEKYEELIGDSGDRCRTCPNYWSDVLRDLRYHLIKILGYQAMKSNRQYMIRADAAYLQIHGLAYVYINEGQESESAKLLTDAIAGRLLKETPDLADVIIKNPNFDAKAGTSTTTAKATTTAKPATAAKPKAATAKAKDVTSKTEEAPVVEESLSVDREPAADATNNPSTETDPGTETNP